MVRPTTQPGFISSRLASSSFGTCFSMTVGCMKRVSQPIVRVSDGFTNVTLNCSVSKGTGIAYYWKKATYLDSENFTSSGSVLVVKSGCEEQAVGYSCVAENPISQQISLPVTIKLCAEGALYQYRLLLFYGRGKWPTSGLSGRC
uniref:Ig-like domain-containing protein n=1 Tax=Callorhinchus milii TaxID=7868 RepID=A0A4W3GSX2_CALMI